VWFQKRYDFQRSIGFHIEFSVLEKNHGVEVFVGGKMLVQKQFRGLQGRKVQFLISLIFQNELDRSVAKDTVAVEK
jgi:hypothetical protein